MLTLDGPEDLPLVRYREKHVFSHLRMPASGRKWPVTKRAVSSMARRV